MATVTINPNGDDTTGWGTSTGDYNYTEIDEGEPASEADYVQSDTADDIDIYDFPTADIEFGAASSVTVRIHGKGGITQAKTIIVRISFDDGANWEAAQSHSYPQTTPETHDFVFGGLDESDMSQFQVEVESDGAVQTNHIYMLTVIITYEPGVAPGAFMITKKYWGV